MGDADRKKPLALMAALIVSAVLVGVVVGRAKQAPAQPRPRALHTEVQLARVQEVADAGVVAIDAGAAIDAGVDDDDDDDERDGGIALAALPPRKGASSSRDIRVRLPTVRLPKVGAKDATKDATKDAAKDAPKDVTPKGVPPEFDAGTLPIDAGNPGDAGPRDAGQRKSAVSAREHRALTVTFLDDLSALVRLVQVDVYVNGKRVAQKKNPEGLAVNGVLHEMSLPSGFHQVRLELVYTGKPGLFSYMESYTFRLRDMRVVEIVDGKPVTYRAIAYDKGATLEFERRLGLKSAIE